MAAVRNIMQRIVIKYSISRTVALTEGRAEYGESSYEPTDTELQFLTLNDRKYLDTLNLQQSVFSLPTGVPPTWPNVADAVKAARQLAINKQAADLAEHEAKIIECLAEPDEKWIVENTDWRYGVNSRSVNIYIPEYSVRNNSWGTSDARIVERIAALQPELLRRLYATS